MNECICEDVHVEHKENSIIFYYSECEENKYNYW